MNGVLAIVVTYRPTTSLQALLQSLVPQAERVLVVDNTPGDGAEVGALLAPWDGVVDLHRMGGNAGIAAAQNVGIARAAEQGFRHVLLSDQDSVPAADMVARLLDACASLQREGVAVGCVCPRYFDETTGQSFRFQVQRPRELFYRSVPADPALPWQEIVTTISSGTLLPVATLQAVGGMREDFFIDHVDTEWCLRARAAGFRNFGVARARLAHRLGDASFPVWYFGWQAYSTYSPVRLYYRFRNFVLLSRLPHVPLRWWLRAAWYWLGNLYAHCLFAPGRLANAKAIARGIVDGLRGRRGPMPGAS